MEVGLIPGDFVLDGDLLAGDAQLPMDQSYKHATTARGSTMRRVSGMRSRKILPFSSK